MGEIQDRWKRVMFGLDEEQPDRAAVTVQVLENTYCLLNSLPEDARNLRHNHKYLIPLVRTIIPNLEAWECPEIEVRAFPNCHDRLLVPSRERDVDGFFDYQTVICQTYTISQFIDNPQYLDYYYPINAELAVMQYFAEAAKRELDNLISSYKERPLCIVIHSMFFLPNAHIEYGEDREEITLALRCALYTPPSRNLGAMINLGADFYRVPSSNVWTEPWF